MEAPARIPRAVLRAVVKHARQRAISDICGKASGLRQAMNERAPDWRNMLDGNGDVMMDERGSPIRMKRYGQSPWRGVAWVQTDEVARSVLSKLQWHGDHYAWQYAGMYIGIEPDGYMHT